MLVLPDGKQVELTDADAKQLAAFLWESAEQHRTAVVAVAINEALHRHAAFRQPIDVPRAKLGPVDAALLGLQ